MNVNQLADHKRLRKIEAEIKVQGVLAHKNIELFTLALLKENAALAESCRDSALEIQGAMMDNIAARILLMRKLGMEVRL